MQAIAVTEISRNMVSTKKTIKVQAPVDERETFVSLQKSFADSEQSAQEKLHTLFQLQATDIEIDKLVQLRGELPDEVAQMQDEIESLKSKQARFSQLIDGYRQTIETSKQSIEDIDAEVEKYKAQIGNVSNSREYDSINKEIENLGLEREIAEKNIVESRSAIADRQYDIERIGDRIIIREGDLAAKQEELSGIVESTAKQEESLRVRRESFISMLDDRTVRAYERIRESSHNHLAVVTLFPHFEDGTYGDSCGGCFHTITPQRVIEVASGRKLVICEHCGRIIVSPEI